MVSEGFTPKSNILINIFDFKKLYFLFYKRNRDLRTCLVNALIKPL